MRPPNMHLPKSLTGSSLLIVDDDDTIRETIRLIFEDTNYTILEASNGKEALTILRESLVPLIVLLDERMPYLNGEEVLRSILRDRSLHHRHTYIFMSAVPHISRHLRLQRLLHALAVETIPKPFDISDLEQAVACAQQRLATHSPLQRLFAHIPGLR